MFCKYNELTSRLAMFTLSVLCSYLIGLSCGSWPQIFDVGVDCARSTESEVKDEGYYREQLYTLDILAARVSRTFSCHLDWRLN